MPPPTDINSVTAWGQYVHWAQIQFAHFLALDEDTPESEYIAVAAHWLAAEYVVLEGWRELCLLDSQINELIDRYPDNCDALRRCRNAVYHFQRVVLDERILRCLTAENEEFMWAVALHSEFQRALVSFPFSLGGTFDEKCELSDEIEAVIGWTPKYAPFAAHLRLLRKCVHLERLYAGVDSPAAAEARKSIEEAMAKATLLDQAPFLKYLERWRNKPKAPEHERRE